MTNEERKALVEELLAAAAPATVTITDRAAACIHTDGQRIAELEIEAEAQYHRGYYDGRAALGDKQ